MLLSLIGAAALMLAAGGGVDTPSIRISVTAAGAPVRGAYVALVAEDRPWTAPAAEQIASEGTLVLRADPGTYRLLAAAPGYASKTVPVQLTSGESRVDVMLDTASSVRGEVVDRSGRPVAGARVARLAPEYTPLAAKFLAAERSTTTDRDGRWSLNAVQGAPFNVVVEALGYASRVLGRGNAVPKVTLEPGAALRLHLDRSDPNWIIALRRIEESDGIETETRTRPASSSLLEWSSLHPGDYTILLRHADPRRVTYDVPAGRVHVTDGEVATQDLTLPAEPPVAAPLRRMLVADVSYPGETRVTQTGPGGGPVAIAYAMQAVAGGTLVYLSSGTFDGLAVVTAQSIHTPKDSERDPRPAVTHDRADVTLRVMPADPEAQLLAAGRAELQECGHALVVPVPFDVARNGEVAFAAPAGCRRIVFRWPPFEPVVLEKSLRAHSANALGDQLVSAGGRLRVRVTRDKSGTVIAAAPVRVLLAQQEEVAVAEAVANVDGWAVFDALPANRRLLIEGRDPRQALTGTAHVVIEPGATATLDPLVVPQPASLTVAPRLAASFRELDPEARILAVHVSSAELDAPKVSQSRNVQGSGGSARFEGLRPGAWLVRAVVQGAGTAQPMLAGTLTLESGEDRRFEPLVEPLVFRGRVLHGERGIEASVGIADPPGPGAVRRRVKSRPDGSFTAVLDRRGTYDVEIVLAPDLDPILVGHVAFDDPSRPVDLVLRSGDVVVRVRDANGGAVAGATVAASYRETAVEGFDTFLRKKTTASGGDVAFDGLRPGVWSFRARDAKGKAAERTVNVADGSAEAIELTLTSEPVLEGTVRDAFGRALPAVSVSCLYVTANRVIRTATARTDARGAFILDIPARLAPEASCGVATPSGQVALFRPRAGVRPEIAVPASTATLTIADWMRFPRETLWLAGPGGAISLNAIAAARGEPWSPIVMTGLGGGDWSIVRARSVEELARLARGSAAGLNTISELRMEPGRRQEVFLEKAP